MRLMHVLVTGASSFIGRYAVATLSGMGLRITASFRSDSEAINQLRIVAPEVDFVRLDLACADAFSALPKKVDFIIHVAGVSTMPQIAVDDFLSCNVVGAHNLLKYALQAGASRVVLASTLSVHGEVKEQVVTETTPIRAPDMYGASKYFAERLFASESQRLPCVALRLPGVLGPGAHRAWIPTLLHRIRNHEEITIYNSKSMFNNAVHVHDLGNLLLKLFERYWSGFHAFPVGAAGQISIVGLVNMLIALTGSRSKVKEGRAPKKPFMISSEYATKNFGYDPFDIEVMLRRYVEDSH